jgi:uncharacterized protein (DUF488 family)
MDVFTIGHSNHSSEVFLALLYQHGITALADVRSHPYSRYLPHFNQAPLKAALKAAGIHYVFLGQALGARSDDPDCYVDGKAVYEKIAATERFQEGIQRVAKAAETYKIALMCAEKDPITCHRAVLVCPHLRAYGLEIQHILSNGDLETHRQLEERLLERHQLKPSEPATAQLSLFSDEFSLEAGTLRSKDEALQEAYRLQGDRIAYVEKTEEKAEQIHEPTH